MNKSLYHPDYKTQPYWWDDFKPFALPVLALPPEVPVVIIGAGYAGLSAAIELNRAGVECVILDANEPGFGGSTRNGGMVSGGVNVGKGYIAKALSPAQAKPFLEDAADAFSHIEDLIQREKIDCGWTRSGYFLGAWCNQHFRGMQAKVDLLNTHAESEAYLVMPEQQRQEIGSDYYRGGMVINRAAHLHPALYFKGILTRAQEANIPIHSNTPVIELSETNIGWRVKTNRGDMKAQDVIIATNGYTGSVTPDLKRRVVPVGSYIIATEELPDGMADFLSPRNRSIADTRRVLTYYRLSPDRKRMIFGGRAKFAPTELNEAAQILHGFMTDRFPELKGVRITHAWTGNVAFTIDEIPHMGKFKNLHYALGCNGSGVAMMTYLGHQAARKIVGRVNRICAFDRPEFPDHPLYNGNPWFLPVVGNYFRARDWLDRRFDQ
jgi:hypothetical protein